MVITILLRSRLHQLENALQVNLHDSAVISEKVVSEVTGEIRVMANGGRPSERVRFFSLIWKPFSDLFNPLK